MNPTAARELLGQLTELTKLLERLDMLVRRNVEAVKKGDFATVRATELETAEVARKIQERNTVRLQLVDSMASNLFDRTVEPRRITLAMLADQAGEPVGESLRKSRRRLQELVNHLTASQRVLRSATATLLGHLEAVFASVRPLASTREGYSPSHGPQICGPAIMDAVG